MKKKLFVLFVFGLLLCPTSRVSADDFNQTFFLSISNEDALPEQNYASINIMGDESEGEIWFLINALVDDPDTGAIEGPFKAGDNFGIQEFGFNTDLSLELDQIIPPDDWEIKINQNVSEFGKFSYVFKGKGSTRRGNPLDPIDTPPLEFHITGVPEADVEVSHFVVLNNKNQSFVAHIAAFSGIFDVGNQEAVQIPEALTSAHFANNPQPDTPIDVIFDARNINTATGGVSEKKVEVYGKIESTQKSIVEEGGNTNLNLEKTEIFNLILDESEGVDTAGIWIDLVNETIKNKVAAIGTNVSGKMNFFLETEDGGLNPLTHGAQWDYGFGFNGNANRLYVYLLPSFFTPEDDTKYHYKLQFVNYETLFGTSNVNLIVSKIFGNEGLANSGTQQAVIPEIPSPWLAGFFLLMGMAVLRLKQMLMRSPCG